MLFVVGVVPFVRFLVMWFTGTDAGHLQSLVFGATAPLGALLCFTLLVLADLQRTNRVLLEETLERLKAIQYPAPAGQQVPAPAAFPDGLEPLPADASVP